MAGVMVSIMKLEQSAVCRACMEAGNRVPVIARAQLSALQAALPRIAPKDPEAKERRKRKVSLIMFDSLYVVLCKIEEVLEESSLEADEQST